MPFLLLVVVVTIEFSAYSQNKPEKEWKITIDGGYSRTTTSDELINYYNYSGHSFRNLKFVGSYKTHRHLLEAQLFVTRSKLYPVNNNPLYYEYNYLDRMAGELRLSYFYSIMKRQSQFSLFAGFSNSSLYSLQHQYYHSLLYSVGLEQRQSYLLSPVNLMPAVALKYIKGKTAVETSFGYSIFNWSARPNDNYVKQIEVDYKAYWRMSFPSQFTNLRYSIMGNYQLKSFGLSLGYELEYNSVRDFKSLQNMVLAGIKLTL
jgi:hypothetical protein